MADSSSFTLFGIISFVIVVLTCIGIVCFYPKFHKFYTKNKHIAVPIIFSYAVFVAIILLFGRYIYAWIDLISYGMNDIIKIDHNGFVMYQNKYVSLDNSKIFFVDTPAVKWNEIFENNGAIKKNILGLDNIPLYNHIFASGADAINFKTDDNPYGILQAGYHGEHLSDAFSLDLCPVTAMLLPVLICYDIKKNTKLSLGIAPWALFGGLLSIFGATMSDFQNGMESTNFKTASEFLEFITIGYPFDRLFYFMHFSMVVSGTVSLLMFRIRYKWTLLISALYFPMIIIYAQIIGGIGGVEKHMSGSVLLDYVSTSQLGKGQFGAVGDVLGLPVTVNDPKIYLVIFIGISLVYICIFLFVTIFWSFQNAKKLNKKFKNFIPIFIDAKDGYIYTKINRYINI